MTDDLKRYTSDFGMYYDRKGTPLTEDEYMAILRSPGYQDMRRVCIDELDGILCSTVWLCLNHNYGSGPPLIFETMVFDRKSEHPWCEGYMARYSTLEEAIAGHRRVWTVIKRALTNPALPRDMELLLGSGDE
jgi:hypothetical protein